MKICILGAGVLGVTSAYELAKRGHEVTVLERQSAAAMECSFANGGQLSYSHAMPWANPYVFPDVFRWMFKDDAPLVFRFKADPHMIRWGLLFLLNCLPARTRRHSEALLRLGVYSRMKTDEIIADTKLDFDYLNKGILHVFSSQNCLDHAKIQADFQHKMGGDPESLLTPEECVKIEPTLAHSNKKIFGGVLAPKDASGDIHKFTQRLATLITEKYGVKFQYGTEIKRLHKADGKISHIETSQGYLSGFDHYVLSTGAYSSVHLRQLGLYVPIYPMKGYSITFPANEFCPTVSLTDEALKVVYSRLGDRIRVAGTAEFAGYNHDIRKVRIDPIVRGVRTLFPKADLSKIDEWACLRPSTPDGPPIIGKTPISNLYLNTGHGTLGWTQAAGSARLLADVFEGIPTEIPMTGLTIERNLIKF
ncbi:MAG: D-amino acid dehydrogenase [Alphaproteobacteria bacterium]|nr:D-amino acid dehydrogenase [Alphaproteobacteria bacterium]